MKKYRLAVFASGSGTNAEKIFEYFSDHEDVEVVLLLSNNPNALVLGRARRFNIPSHLFDRAEFQQPDVFMPRLHSAGVTHIVLAGFLWLIPKYLIDHYPDRIINIHPALLPSFGGKGMYGMKVHEAVKKSGVKETGITIHLVNEHYDEGAVLFQGRCMIDESCSPEEIAKRVHAMEHAYYPQVIEKWAYSS
jgi:phosphoribosylglycinamide formyltransferase 1